MTELQTLSPDLLGPVSTERPAGANLEYDAEFQRIVRLADGTREQQYGATIVAARSPDYAVIGPVAAQLALLTRDLRLGVLLTEAWTSTRGWSGLADGLELLRGWTVDFWADVHPPIEDAQSGDPFERVNALARLCQHEHLPRLIAALPVAPTAHGDISVSDLDTTAAEEGSATKLDRIRPEEIEAACLSMSSMMLRRRCDFAESCQTSLRDLVQFLESIGGPGVWNATAITGPIDAGVATLQSHLRRRQPSPAVSRVAEETASDDSPDDRPVMSGSIQSRQQAAEVLNQIADYFRRHEPSSPVPLILDRAVEMLDRDFLAIIRELAPDAVVGLKNLAGEK